MTDLFELPRATPRAESVGLVCENEVETTPKMVPFSSVHPTSWNGLLEALPEPTALVDVRCILDYVNGLLCALTGYETTDMIGRYSHHVPSPRLHTRRLVARSQGTAAKPSRLGLE